MKQYEFTDDGTRHKSIYRPCAFRWCGFWNKWEWKNRSHRNQWYGKIYTFENCGWCGGIRFQKAQYGKYGKDMLSATDTGVWRGRDGTSGSSAWNHQWYRSVDDGSRGKIYAESAWVFRLWRKDVAYVRRTEEKSGTCERSFDTGRYFGTGRADEPFGQRDVWVAGGVSDQV